MVYAAISWKGKTELVFLSGNLEANSYVQMLDKHIAPFRGDYYPDGDMVLQ